MTLNELISKLEAIREKLGPNAEVDLLIETYSPMTMQLQFPLNDIATSKRQGKVILMHEKFVATDSGEPESNQ